MGLELVTLLRIQDTIFLGRFWFTLDTGLNAELGPQ